MEGEVQWYGQHGLKIGSSSQAAKKQVRDDESTLDLDVQYLSSTPSRDGRQKSWPQLPREP